MNDQSDEGRETEVELDQVLIEPPTSQFVRVTPDHELRLLDQLSYTVPNLRVHCSYCDGERSFRSGTEKLGPFKRVEAITLSFVCGDCQASTKTYALLVQPNARRRPPISAWVAFRKFGEDPPFGAPLPTRVLSMVGPDKDLFLKGKRCENQGLGVGAFAYYRRVVDAHWQRILAEIIRVAEGTGSPKPMLENLRAAAKETQFSKAVAMVKEGIPESLKINGRNPLTLLYAAISDHLHDQDDAACLELAASVRQVLAALAERTALALKEKTELHAAVERLAQAKSKPKPKPA